MALSQACCCLFCFLESEAEGKRRGGKGKGEREKEGSLNNPRKFALDYSFRLSPFPFPLSPSHPYREYPRGMLRWFSLSGFHSVGMRVTTDRARRSHWELAVR